MLKYVFLFLLIQLSLISSEKFTPSDNKNLAVVYTYDENIRDKFDEFLSKDLQEINYFLNDPHKNVNVVYAKKYGSTVLDNLAFGSIVNEPIVRPMFNIDPRFAGFSPFNLLIHKAKNEKQTYVSHLTPEAILDILEIDDKELRVKYIKSFEPLDKMIQERLGGKKSIIPLKGYAKDSMMNFEIPFEEPEDLDDFLDEFQEKFESAFVQKEYIIAGFYNFKESYNSDEDELEQFESFWSYALCHLTYSYHVFDKEKGLPLAGIFAPCSMYIYVKTGENKLVIGMPTLMAWGAAFGVTEPEKLKLMKQLDKEIPEIIRSLGGVDMPNGNPLKSKPIKVEKKDDGAISTFLIGSHLSVQEVQKSLKKGGFEVLATTALDRKKELTSITFTSASLQKLASKKTRGYMGVLKVLVDDKKISIENPHYFAKAYLQDDFDEAAVKDILKNLNNTFKTLKNSTDKMKLDKLSEYRFTDGMPEFEDMMIVGRGDNETLLKKAEKNSQVVFKLSLSDGSTLLGVKMSKRVNKLVKKTGPSNSSLLPYLVLIEDGKAKVLAPRYNIALHAPLLDLDAFMRLASAPGAIIKECGKIFR